MTSPYVRRLRLGTELRGLRSEAGLTQAALAKLIGRGRMDITRLETGSVIDLEDVFRILDTLHVEGDRWKQITAIASEASQSGWWDSVKNMGDRQSLIANLESGAARIRQYEQTFLPGLLQEPEFVQALTAATESLEPVEGAVEGVLAGRAGRQRMLRSPIGPALEVIIDEVAIRRLTAPATVLKKQLHHMASLVSDNDRISLHVLPVDVQIKDFTVPRSAFTIFTYPDPGDPQVVAVDTVTSDLILTDTAQVSPYETLYEHLREAALPTAESLEYLTAQAARLDS